MYVIRTWNETLIKYRLTPHNGTTNRQDVYQSGYSIPIGIDHNVTV